MSHTSAQVVVVTTSKRVLSASHRDLHPLRVSPTRFVASFGHEGGEGGVYVFLLSGISFKNSLAITAGEDFCPSSRRGRS